MIRHAFGKERDNIFTLWQIMEQCQEWNKPACANFIDFEDYWQLSQRLSVMYSPALWNPYKTVSIIKPLYGDFASTVICG